MENVVIDFTSQTKGIKDADDALAKLGKTDQKNAEQFAKNNKQFQEGVKKNSEHLSEFKSHLLEIGKALGIAFGVEKIIELGKESVKAFAESEKAAKLLQTALGNNEASLKEFLELAEKLEQKSIFSHKQIEQAETMALQFGLTKDQVLDLIPVISDFASATGQQLQGALEGVLRGTEGQARGLKVYGIEVQHTGDRTRDLAQITDQLNAKFKGQSEVVGNTTFGAFEKLGNSIEKAKENTGEFLVELGSAIGYLLGIVTPIKESTSLFTLQQREVLALGTEYDKLDAPTQAIIRGQRMLGESLQETTERIERQEMSISAFKVTLHKFNEQQIEDLRNSKDATSETIEFLRKYDLKKQQELDALNAKQKEESTNTIEHLKQQLAGLQDTLDKTEIGTKLFNETQAHIKKVQAAIDAAEGKISDTEKKANDEAERKKKEHDAKMLGIFNKYLEDTYKLAVDQVKVLNDLALSDESPLEQENRLYDERLKAAGIFYKQFDEMTELEQDAYTSSMQTHLENIAEIEGDSEQQRYDRLVSFNEAKKAANKDYTDSKLDLIEAENNALVAGSELAASLFAKDSGFGKAFFIFSKIAAIGNIIMQLQREKAANMLVASEKSVIIPTLSEFYYGEALAKNQAANIRAGIGIATVAAQAIPALKFAKGTKSVEGGVKGQDSVHALLMPDEMVIPTDRKRRYATSLNAIFDEKIAPSVINEFVNSYQKHGANFNANVNARIDEYLLGRVFTGSNKNVVRAIEKLGRNMSQPSTKLIARREGWA